MTIAVQSQTSLEFYLQFPILEDGIWAHGTPYFHVCFATGYGERRLKNRRLRTGQGITGVAAATRKTVVVNDVRRDARYIPAVDGILSEMAVPLVARGRVIGVIDFESTKVNAFGNRERSLLRPIGGRIALAVDNASMHERTAAGTALSNRWSRSHTNFPPFSTCGICWRGWRC